MIPEYYSTSGAYLGVIENMLRESEKPESAAKPRGLAIHEKLAYAFRVKSPSSEPIKTNSPERNKVIASYLAKEIELYDSGELRASEFAKASKFWLKIQNPDGTINSNYGSVINRKDTGLSHEMKDGFRVFDYGDNDSTRWSWAVTALVSDKDSRQAVVHISSPRYLWTGNRDQVCTMYLQFFIRQDKLHMHWNMRSNDCVKGLAYDLSYASLLQERMLETLLLTYSNLQIGTLTWFAGSMHLYDNDIPVVKEMLGYAVL